MTFLHKLPRITALSLAATLSGCAASDGAFPSLERRPFETVNAVSPPAPATAAKLSPGLVEKIKALTARHEAAFLAFNLAVPRVQAIAQGAAGSAQGTENWVNAHLELSRLDQDRADSVAALGELDALIAAQADQGSDDVALLRVHQAAVATDVSIQRSVIERLSRLIGE
jgi:hypothetical protein